MARDPLWLYAATDEPQPEETRLAVARGWIRRVPQPEPEQQREAS